VHSLFIYGDSYHWLLYVKRSREIGCCSLSAASKLLYGLYIHSVQLGFNLVIVVYSDLSQIFV